MTKNGSFVWHRFKYCNVNRFTINPNWPSHEVLALILLSSNESLSEFAHMRKLAGAFAVRCSHTLNMDIYDGSNQYGDQAQLHTSKWMILETVAHLQ